MCTALCGGACPVVGVFRVFWTRALLCSTVLGGNFVGLGPKPGNVTPGVRWATPPPTPPCGAPLVCFAQACAWWSLPVRLVGGGGVGGDVKAKPSTAFFFFRERVVDLLCLLFLLPGTRYRCCCLPSQSASAVKNVVNDTLLTMKDPLRRDAPACDSVEQQVGANLTRVAPSA